MLQANPQNVIRFMYTNSLEIAPEYCGSRRKNFQAQKKLCLLDIKLIQNKLHYKLRRSQRSNARRGSRCETHLRTHRSTKSSVASNRFPLHYSPLPSAFLGAITFEPLDYCCTKPNIPALRSPPKYRAISRCQMWACSLYRGFGQ